MYKKFSEGWEFIGRNGIIAVCKRPSSTFVTKAAFARLGGLVRASYVANTDYKNVMINDIFSNQEMWPRTICIISRCNFFIFENRSTVKDCFFISGKKIHCLCLVIFNYFWKVSKPHKRFMVINGKEGNISREKKNHAIVFTIFEIFFALKANWSLN